MHLGKNCFISVQLGFTNVGFGNLQINQSYLMLTPRLSQLSVKLADFENLLSDYLTEPISYCNFIHKFFFAISYNLFQLYFTVLQYLIILFFCS